MPYAPSSPVVGTNVCLAFGASDAPAPVAAPVVDWNRVADALAAAGNSLLLVADALRGGKVDSPSHSLTPSRPSSHPVAFDPATVVEGINAFLVAKAGAGKSDRYLRTMKNSLSKFARGRGGKLLGEVSVAEIEEWLRRSDWSGTTRRGYLRDVRTLYNFAMRRSLVGHNPACVVELPASSTGAIRFHTPTQVRTILNAARRHDLNVCRVLAIRYFTGVRSSEFKRLTEESIRLDTGFVEVSAANARKTRQRRLIPIRENLRAWLRLGGVPVGDVDNRVRLFKKTLDVPWPDNFTRHSFVTYAVAKWGAKETALEAGHSEDMLFGHYRALVTPREADEFWSIYPA